jgi:hypothetical protein
MELVVEVHFLSDQAAPLHEKCFEHGYVVQVETKQLRVIGGNWWRSLRMVLSDCGDHFDIGFIVMVFICIVFRDFRMSVRHESKRAEALVAYVEQVPGDETMINDIIEECLVTVMLQ